MPSIHKESEEKLMRLTQKIRIYPSLQQERARSTQNNGCLGRFVRFLAYKAELAGKKVIEIDEAYTSKECYVCGARHDMPLWMRTMSCDCGNVIDRDQNSSVNIMVRFLSQNALWTGYQQFVGNLRKTGLPAPLQMLEVHSQEAPCVNVG